MGFVSKYQLEPPEIDDYGREKTMKSRSTGALMDAPGPRFLSDEAEVVGYSNPGGSSGPRPTRAIGCSASTARSRFRAT